MSNVKGIGTHVSGFNQGVVLKPFLNGKIIDLGELKSRGDNATHGDVIIIKCNESDMPKDFDSLPSVPNGFLALGEHSGHAHALAYDDGFNGVPVFSNMDYETKKPKLTSIPGTKNEVVRSYAAKVDKNGSIFLRITGEPFLLKHQEHFTFRIHPGTYEIGIQQEYDPFEQKIRQIAD